VPHFAHNCQFQVTHTHTCIKAQENVRIRLPSASAYIYIRCVKKLNAQAV